MVRNDNSQEQPLRSYFNELVRNEPIDRAAGKTAWRMSCFRTGLAYADYVEKHHFPVERKRVLDAACAWGGHAASFAVRGSQVVAADVIDHEFARFSRFCTERGLSLSPCLSACECLPFEAESFDLILALELVEHIRSVDPFAAEVARLLRPGGLCLVSTPPRLRSLIEGEPHYGLKGLTALPFALQGLVARRLFGRSYPYPIVRQYFSASQIIGAFQRHGLEGRPVLWGSLGWKLRHHLRLQAIAGHFFWNFLVIGKPTRSGSQDSKR